MRDAQKKIRIHTDQLEAIIECFTESFGKEDHLWLFGSRVDPQKKGGDIDFYIETEQKDPTVAIEKKFLFLNKLWKRIGEQKIDVVLNILSITTELPIYKIAKNEGVQLV